MLVGLELSSPALTTVPLKSATQGMLGFISIEWDKVHQRLVGLALIDGEMTMSSLDAVSGNVMPMAKLGECGACECSPTQGVSALDAERSIYYMASQVTL